jgi:hypothetical protein
MDSPSTPGDKKREPLENKFSIKKTLKGRKPFYATDKYVHVQVMGDPPFFLAVLSQPLGPGGPTSFCTSALLLFQCAVKLVLLNLT